MSIIVEIGKIRCLTKSKKLLFLVEARPEYGNSFRSKAKNKISNKEIKKSGKELIIIIIGVNTLSVLGPSNPAFNPKESPIIAAIIADGRTKSSVTFNLSNISVETVEFF